MSAHHVNPAAAYRDAQELARDKRERYQVDTNNFGLREIRRIYSTEKIKIDLWPYKLRKLKGAYWVINDQASILLNGSLPDEPRLFAMAHELKHHFADRENSADMRQLCASDPAEFGYGKAPVTEIAAEIFAAEFIFPENEFKQWALANLPQSEMMPSDVVELKQICPAKVSYTFITKRLERLKFTKPGQFNGVQWIKLERSIYGIPWYLKPRN